LSIKAEIQGPLLELALVLVLDDVGKSLLEPPMARHVPAIPEAAAILTPFVLRSWQTIELATMKLSRGDRSLSNAFGRYPWMNGDGSA